MVRLVCVALLSSVAAAGADRGDTLFRDFVQPLLRENCVGCHGAGQTLSKLDLRSRQSLLQGGLRGTAVVPGKPEESPLYKVLIANGLPQMPPGGPEKKINNSIVSAVREWIQLGALWPNEITEKQWKYQESDLWTFRPLRRMQVPANENPIDYFLDQKLKEKGLESAVAASRRDLILRANYDLNGLPPSAEEIESFVKDKDPKSFEKLVDRLLASPRYGEKWGRHWLDVVRYSDSDGFSNDFERPNAWRYRDYVIRSFNSDKPYDQFIREQIAGDELDPRQPEHLIATGFLRMGPWEHTAMSVAAVTRQQWLDDVTNAVGTTFLGLTYGCARCHDHKFDPISTAEYYSLQSVFSSTFFDNPKAAFLPNENTSRFTPERDRLLRLLDWVKQQRTNYRDLAEVKTAAKLSLSGPDKLSDDQRKEARSKLLNLDPQEVEIERNYAKRQGVYEHQLPRFDPLVYGVKTDKPEETFILTGGNLQARAARVSPGVLAVPARYKADLDTPISEAQSGRRLALANWIARPDNPLTARVMVNRIWHFHFGRGLAANPNNFGKMGKKPSHPELLDYLASHFIEHGWSVKDLHRIIMASKAYQQSTVPPDAAKVEKLDPDNELRSYFQPRRLEAEEIRDSLLAAAGELNESAGGPGSFAEINVSVALQPIFIMGQLAPIWRPSAIRADRHRRSIYLYSKRGIPDPLLDLFNQPVSSDSCERRDATTVPMQAFALFNAQFPRDMALALAERIGRQENSPTGRIRQLYRNVLRRDPTPDETSELAAHLAKQEAVFAGRPVPPPTPQTIIQREVVGESNGLRFSIQEEVDPTPYEANLHPSQVSPAVRALASAALVLLNSNEFLYVY